jgi:hypothetical protein
MEAALAVGVGLDHVDARQAIRQALHAGGVDALAFPAGQHLGRHAVHAQPGDVGDAHPGRIEQARHVDGGVQGIAAEAVIHGRGMACGTAGGAALQFDHAFADGVDGLCFHHAPLVVSRLAQPPWLALKGL